MNFEISFGETTTDSIIDGYMSWSARGTQDGAIPPKNFFIKTNDGEKVVLNAIKDKKKGVVMDIHNMQTGWQRFAEGQSDWVWNDDLKHWKPKPGDDYKQGLSIPCSINNDKLVIYRMAGVAVIESFKNLSQQINGNDTGKLPVVVMTDCKEMKFKVGSTQIPTLTVIDWVDRPFILDAQQDKDQSSADESAVELPANSEF